MTRMTTVTNDTKQCFADNDSRWRAVVNRDPLADGKFYYSVRTTGVYCRPTCAARLALRRNVDFHDSREDAVMAGFRPCKRCKPESEGVVAQQAAAVANACHSIEESDEMPCLEDLARSAGMSTYYFHRQFKKLTGLTPKAHGMATRSNRVRRELTHRSNVTAAIYGAGFNSNSRFYESSNAVLGMTPKEFQSKGRGSVIRFAIGESWLGPILVAVSDKGICAILLGDDPDKLIHELEEHFTNAQLIGGDPEFEKLVAIVIGFVEAPSKGLELPLDIRGTSFQQRVWQALRKIPPGSTASYADIAKRIERPKSVRAVAQACGANGLAVAIPCHRVVRTDGGLSGYRWGVERKEKMLQRENGQSI
jgi:AraC family transcriptional regulator of adaptative response/methylated-DNA-[protein]-cysteine methyltransferase